MSGRVAFIANSLDNAYLFQRVLASLHKEVAAGSLQQLHKLLDGRSSYDLVVFEARDEATGYLPDVFSFAEDSGSALLVILNATDIDWVRFPETIASDFVVHGAGEAECLARVKRLLQQSEPHVSNDVVTIDTMTINFATYQVGVAGQPIDFTYLEYALLAYLVKHPNKTFSRDVLLQHVWGFDYYGGSRTVDVHVRRIRAKLGPDLAQHLETVRGVGYLWSGES